MRKVLAIPIYSKLIYEFRSILFHSIITKCAMHYFDLRFCIIVLINMAKSQIGGISRDLITWTNLFCFLLILAAFSFVSIEVPLVLFTCSFQ